ncbi:hypothetical protein [Butyrivibrio sp. MC2021]|uniref:hypothetical protein n=1 Tax=Butyrivibrio sp. MC2021 TaxID=1408306 RepID=UPI00047E9E11|nr:hypothetical protein [Butyrivibrio sp. MC2021]
MEYKEYDPKKLIKGLRNLAIVLAVIVLIFLIASIKEKKAEEASGFLTPENIESMELYSANVGEERVSRFIRIFPKGAGYSATYEDFSEKVLSEKEIDPSALETIFELSCEQSSRMYTQIRRDKHKQIPPESPATRIEFSFEVKYDGGKEFSYSTDYRREEEQEFFDEVMRLTGFEEESIQKELAEQEAEAAASESSSEPEIVPLLSSIEDIGLSSADGKNYTFTYDDRQYTAIYTPDHWKIRDSYDINSIEDMTIICQALINEHPIHGRDMVNYRTVDDMVYEWEVHNIAYFFFSDKDEAKAHAKDVDFNPEDAGLTFEEYYDKYSDF